MFTYILDLLLVLAAVWMLLRGRFGATRQLALAPLVLAVLDVTFAGQIDPSLTPVLSVLLAALQLVMLVGCALVLRRDRALARSKETRRRRRREMARTRAAFEAAAARRTTGSARPAACA